MTTKTKNTGACPRAVETQHSNHDGAHDPAASQGRGLWESARACAIWGANLEEMPAEIGRVHGRLRQEVDALERVTAVLRELVDPCDEVRSDRGQLLQDADEIEAIGLRAMQRAAAVLAIAGELRGHAWAREWIEMAAEAHAGWGKGRELLERMQLAREPHPPSTFLLAARDARRRGHHAGARELLDEARRRILDDQARRRTVQPVSGEAAE